jgi:restriction system protein
MIKEIGEFTFDGPEDTYTSAGNHSGYRLRMEHKGLSEGKNISARYMDDLQDKINMQISRWEIKWEKAQKTQSTKEKLETANKETEDAKAELNRMENILAHTLDIDDTLDWERLKVSVKYEIPKPKKPTKPAGFKKPVNPAKPVKGDIVKPCPLLKGVFGGRAKWDKEQEALYGKAVEGWQKRIDDLGAKFDKKKAVYEERIADFEAKFLDWEKGKEKFILKQNKKNSEIEILKDSYNSKIIESIERYCALVLDASDYPDYFPKVYNLEYNKESKILLIDYHLPNQEQVPKKTLMRYLTARDVFEEKFLSASQHEKLYDSVIYQIVLRTIHEIFEADSVEAIDCITFNGIVSDISKATGQDQTTTIVSITTLKDKFLEINLGVIDPKACFKSLKGVGSAKLSGITPVAPLAVLSTSDKRFTDHYDVADSLDMSTNLASMHWEDFEHLVREIFEKEFGRDGGEVKVTQASSDGGVDAIAFDPDPIRGGKIVIQAKRYTNTVGVSAVRDLYGTVMNEGANKGILVTTSDFGPDSYDFVKDKPLTLLNGANLLNLLEKYGHKAKIDIREAKLELLSQEAVNKA